MQPVYSVDTASAASTLQKSVTPKSCTIKQTERELDGYGIVTVTVGANTSRCSAVVATLDLSQHAELVGQVVYMLVQMNVTLPDTSVALSIDPADGTGPHFSADWDEAPNSWRMLEYQMSELEPALCTDFFVAQLWPVAFHCD